MEVLANDAGEILKYLSKDQFNFENQFIAENKVSVDLVKISSSKIFFTRTGMKVKAHSEGTSIIVLPLQFSHCLQLRNTLKSEQTLAPNIMRVNLMQTGLLFSGTIDAEINYAYGPFNNPFCRIKDYQDLKFLTTGHQNHLLNSVTS